MREIIIKKNDAGQRLDKFLTKKFKNMPISLIYKLIRKKKITVNRKRTKENVILSEGDLILIFVSDELLGGDSSKKKFTAGKVNVIYEDENILIVDKESGLIVHSDTNDESDTLIDRITAYLINKEEFNPDEENSFAPALCNRIDRNTQGLVIAAKNAQALREMNDIIKNRNIQKTYLAVVHGVIKPQEGEIKLQLEKDSDKNIVKVKNTSTVNSKTAITKYKTIDKTRNNDFSLLEIELITGRTHQIRATFAHIGHPLLGDGKYAVNKKDREIGYKSQALCSYSIKFVGCEKYELLSYLNKSEFIATKPDFLKLFM
ncbi:MAG: RluA family pseudouridine synthase [Ruminococcaceae bacterium]|nr:RluA family pseudouridine synthase [Oscillospiraceae bacterium]